MKYVIVDSNDISRAGLKSLLLASGKSVEESADYSLISRADAPAVLLLGLNEESMESAMAQLDARLRIGKKTNILCISSTLSVELCDTLSHMGVQGFCSGSISADMLALAIRAVENGAFFVCPKTQQKRTIHLRKKRTDIGEELSPRERDVLVQLVNGNSNQDIAKNLNISVETVKAHVKSILAKLAVHDRTQAVVKAIKFGLVEYLSAKGELKN